jgi:hypothetical protein
MLEKSLKFHKPQKIATILFIDKNIYKAQRPDDRIHVFSPAFAFCTAGITDAIEFEVVSKPCPR